MRRYEMALSDLSLAIELEPSNSKFYYNRALCFYDMNQVEKVGDGAVPRQCLLLACVCSCTSISTDGLRSPCLSVLVCMQECGWALSACANVCGVCEHPQFALPPVQKMKEEKIIGGVAFVCLLTV